MKDIFLNFIEIGTSDFDTCIQNCNDNDYGLSIEPILYYLNKLPSKKNVKKINCAISDTNGTCNIFFINEENIEKYDLPISTKGCNSIDKYHPTIYNLLKEKNIKNKSSLFDKIVIDKYTLFTLLNKYDIYGTYMLKIDTEGHDCIILKKFIEENNNNLLLPHNITFETNQLTSKIIVNDTINKFIKIGYDIISSNRKSDTIIKLNLNKINKQNIFSIPITKYYIKDENNKIDVNNLPYNNNLDDAKLYCQKINGTGVSLMNNIYIVNNGNYLYLQDNEDDSITWIYL